MTIDEMIERKRELGYTNEQIADLSGIPLGTVQKIFAGQTKAPRYNTIRKLEAVLQENADARSVYGTSPTGASVVSEMTGSRYAGSGEEMPQSKGRGYSGHTIRKEDYSPVPVSRRIGIAKGRFQVPEDDFFYNDEITELFGGQ